MKKHVHPLEQEESSEPGEVVEEKDKGTELGSVEGIQKSDVKTAELEKQLSDANQKIKELQDKWLRSEADLDNFRKRVTKEKAEWREFYHEEILEEILPVLDNFDRALLSKLEGDEAKMFAEGIILVDKQLHEILSKHGLMEIEAVGKPFNPHFHEAMMTVETDEYPEDMVVEEVRKGYIRDEKVIRPAMVKVSKTKQEISE